MAPTNLRRMPRIPGSRKRARPVLRGADPTIAERGSDQLQRIVNSMGGTSDALKIAKRVLVLKQQFPAGSVPELITYNWLEQRQIPFFYQATLFGGRREKGGLVPDFVLQYGGKGICWQIQGEYWHQQLSAHGQKDVSNRLRLLGQVYKGVRIDYVVELWEKDILRKRPQVYLLGLQGIGMRE